MYEPEHRYVRPQENGNKTDVRWAAWTNKKGAGLLAVGRPLISVSAWSHTMTDMRNAKHVNELLSRKTITVNIDYKQTGVAGDNSWDARAHEQYTLLTDEPYRWQVWLKPIENIEKVDTIISQKQPELK